MLRTISLLDILSDDEEDISDGENNTHVAVPIEENVASQTGVALAIRNPISKKRAREPKTRKKHVLEKKTRRKKKSTISNITAKRTSSQNYTALEENQPTQVTHNGNPPCIQGAITLDESRPPIRKLDFVNS
ncbi:hypothetical protein FRX31_031151 [Thalictrum thalictroides]|uniref:Uncharacterized protein n=1 Tax=Thalictrum thalictroides TaxID=46969 RepID=A0A7J6V378_THATH|nr:hypothetical protein FRX31_031151 [Thalictrum thalictroides]